MHPNLRKSEVKMPKLKTKKAVAKRFRITRSGKILRLRAGGSHLMRKKTAKRRRALRKKDVVSPAEKQRIRRLLPYG